MRAQAQGDRVLRHEVGRVPMRAVADLADRRLRRADKAHDLAVLQFRVIAEQPEDGVRPLVAPGKRCVAGRLLGGGDLRDVDLHLRQAEDVVGVLLAALDFLAGELVGGDRVEALDALRDVSVGDAFDLQHMETAEGRDLLECERGIRDQPDGGRLGHQRLAFGHNGSVPGLRAGSAAQTDFKLKK